MSDEEEESMSEGFSASEEEWKPTKDVRGGESSDDDDSDFEESPQAEDAQSGGGISSLTKKRGTHVKSVVKQTGIKKRKGAVQSLRTKLYNKYRPPPKTFPSPNSAGGNSPSASTSRTASKNAKAPNESGEPGSDSSSDSSVENYLVNPADLNLRSSFFNVRNEGKAKSVSPPPVFDCNAGITNLSDSGSEDNNESSAEEIAKAKAFDFADLLDNVNSLERAKETIAKRVVNTKKTAKKGNSTVMDVNSLLALGEKQYHSAVRSVNLNDEEDEEDNDDDTKRAPQRLSKTKSTRIKRHTKTRPASTVVAGDTDDSDFEEVADDTYSAPHSTTLESSGALNSNGGLEIRVEMDTRQRRTKKQKQQDLEAAFKRKLNRDLKESYRHLHKTSLLCCFARSYCCNRMLNDTALMQAALQLLPSNNAYPPESGTEIKYYQSLVTWYRTSVKLASSNLYAEKVQQSRKSVKTGLMAQIKRKEASCKQDFVFIFVVLLRAMGLQCRLIVNMQPLPLRPAQADLITIKLKRDGEKKDGDGDIVPKKATVEAAKESVGKGRIHRKSGEADKNKQGLVKLKGKPEKVEKDIAEEGTKKIQGKDKNKGNEQERKKEGRKVKVGQKRGKEEKDCKENETETKGREQEHKKALSAKLAEKKTVGNVRISKIPNSNKPNENANPQLDRALAARCSSRTVRGKEKDFDKVTKIAKENYGADNAQVNPKISSKPRFSKLRATRSAANEPLNATEEQDCHSVETTPIARRTRNTSTDKPIMHKIIAKTKSNKPVIQVGSPVIPRIVLHAGKTVATEQNGGEIQPHARVTRSRSKSPKLHISPTFLQTTNYKNQFTECNAVETRPKGKHAKRNSSTSPSQKFQISPEFLHQKNVNAVEIVVAGTRDFGSGQKSLQVAGSERNIPQVPQLDGADDGLGKRVKQNRLQLKKLHKKSRSKDESDEDFEPSPTKQPKRAAKLPAKKADKATSDRRVLSSDEAETTQRNSTAADIWAEVWSDAEERWVCIELFTGKLHSVEAIKKAASSNLAYVIAFQNDLTIKDVTARYCPNWTTTVCKSRVEHAWLETAFVPYYGQRTIRDICEDQELRRIHEEKPMPTSIAAYKDHPLYALERHLLKFQAIYPPNPPTLGFVRGEPVYARECVHTLHSREIWLKQARTVKLGEQPYKIVKARPKWDRLTQTVIKDQPLEIFGYWQTEDYEPPTAENGIVPRNAYGNVELFKECMLPKKTTHLRLPGLARICKKLGVDCANAVIGFDFHQGSCHPLYDGFVVCEEFADQVTAAWYQDQEEQERRENEKYEARVYGNWKKLIKGLLIRERLKKKYNF